MRFTRFALATLAATAAAPWTNAAECASRDKKYGCGECYEKAGYCDRPPGDGCHCCCRDDGANGGLHVNTCDGAGDRGMDKGCNSCMGKLACYGASNSLIGDDSCHDEKACNDMNDSFIQHDSCHGKTSCKEMKNTHVGTNSCEGDNACYTMLNSTITSNSCHDDSSCKEMKNTHVGTNSCEGDYACYQVEDSTIGDNSCQNSDACLVLKNSNIGHGSCNKSFSCGLYALYKGDYGVGLTIGKNSCNQEWVCYMCENDSVVPDNSCNEGTSDTTLDWAGDSVCNYCQSTLHSTTFDAQCTAAASLTEGDLNLKKSCEEVADELKSFGIDLLKAHSTFRNFVHEDIIDNCSGGGTFSNAVEFISDPDNGTCAIMIGLLSRLRWKNGDEIALKDYMQKGLNMFVDESSDISCSFIEVTDTMIEKHCTKAAAAGSKSSKNSSTNEGAKAKAGKHGKSSQAEAMVARHRTREHAKSGKDGK